MALGVSVVVLSYMCVALLRRWAERWNAIDIPNERSSHTRPTPRGGGLAIAGLTLVGLGLAAWFTDLQSSVALVAYLGGSGIVAAVSWIDDRQSLSNRVRFAVHSLAALLAIWGIGYWNDVALPTLLQFQLGWIGLLVTFIWIVGLTNAYNFMDGIDGIAGGQAVVAGFAWAMLGWLIGDTLTRSVGLLIAASSLGFLGHNWPPARIFMGDVGSAFLGYSFAILPLFAVLNHPGLLVFGVLVVWPFLFDTVFTFFRRLRRGENVFAAHRSHLYQRLVIAGYSHRAISVLYIGLALIGVVFAFAWMNYRVTGIASLVLLPFLGLLLWRFALRAERQQHVANVPPVGGSAHKA